MLVAICSLFDQSSPIKYFLIFCMIVEYSPQWPLVPVSNKRQTCMRNDYIETNSWNNKAMSWHKHSPYQSCDLFGQRHIPRALAGADRSRKSLKYGLWLSRPYSLKETEWGLGRAACVAGDFFWVSAKELPGFENAREQVKRSKI